MEVPSRVDRLSFRRSNIQKEFTLPIRVVLVRRRPLVRSVSYITARHLSSRSTVDCKGMLELVAPSDSWSYITAEMRHHSTVTFRVVTISICKSDNK